MSENELATHTIDRSRWQRGPWDQEPEDRIEWRAEGFGRLPCLMLRSGLGSWCGYVGVPPGHPAYDKDYNAVDVEVHGGLTYGDRCGGHICHVPQSGETDAVFWLGFDCAHSRDLVPGMDPFHSDGSDAYRDIPYVRSEVDRLAAQLAAMETK